MNTRPVHVVLVLLILLVWGGVYARFQHLRKPAGDEAAPQAPRAFEPPAAASGAFSFQADYPDPFHYGFPAMRPAALAPLGAAPVAAPRSPEAARGSFPAGEAGGFAPPAFAAPLPAPDPAPTKPAPVLVGIVGGRALVQLGEDRVVVVGEGGWVDGHRVERVEPNEVLLRTPGGPTLVLRLR